MLIDRMEVERKTNNDFNFEQIVKVPKRLGSCLNF